MKVIVTTYIIPLHLPLHWDCKPGKESIYDLNDEMERRFYIRDMTNIDPDEYKTVEEYREEKDHEL